MDMEEWKKKIRDENWQLSLTIQGRFWITQLFAQHFVAVEYD
jgi:hypothetical protein